jgi:hypothetical protein
MYLKLLSMMFKETNLRNIKKNTGFNGFGYKNVTIQY